MLAGPNIEKDGLSTFTLEDIRLLIEERHGVLYHVNHVGELMRRLGLSRQKARPSHPKKDEAAAAAFKKGRQRAEEIAATLAPKGKHVSVWFQDEARIGQKGRVCHIWWKRGERPAGPCDKRFTFAYIFAEAKIGSDDAFALVMPEANTGTMQKSSTRSRRRCPRTTLPSCTPTRPAGTGRTTCASPTTSS